VLSQTAWLQVLRNLRVNLWSGGRMMVARANTLMDASGNLADEATRRQLAEFVLGFAAFAAKAR
jgi:hypothetical protein